MALPMWLDWLALALALVAPGIPADRHPADGPDVDVRVLIGSSGLTMTILANLAFVDEVADSVREDDQVLHPIEHEAHRLDLLDHFRATNRVEIDGIAVDPVFKSFEVGEADLTLLPLFPRMGTKALIKLQLILEYPAKSPPKKATIVWGVFPDDLALETEAGVPPMKVVVQLTAKGLRSRVELSEDEPGYTWHNTGETLADRFEAVPEAAGDGSLEVPLLSAALFVLAGLGAAIGALRRGMRRRPVLWVAVPILVMAGIGTTDLMRARVPDLFGGGRLPARAEALAAFRPLHANIYRAFDYVDEGEIYDALERSVHGNLLDRLYNQIYRSLIMQEQGGAVSQVEAVRPIDTEVESIGRIGPDDAAGFTVVTRWQVDGAVFHWGHSHHRTNEYRARYTVVQTDVGWRIKDNQILEQVTVRTSTTDPRASAGTGR